MKKYISGNTYPVKEQLKKIGCRWDPQSKSWYAESDETYIKALKIVDPHPIYNSPPPADLGMTDPVALAAVHGRTAVAGAAVRSFICYGLARGDNGEPNGTLHKIKEVRYVQVARTARRYLSRDDLEDFDMFDTEPGGSYQWDGIEVVPTPEETLKDTAAKSAAEAKAAAPKMWEMVVTKIDQTVSETPAWAKDETLVAKWGKPVMVHTAAYPAIYASDTDVYYHVPGYFACDWDTPAVHKTAPLTPELRTEIESAVQTCALYGFLKEAPGFPLK